MNDLRAIPLIDPQPVLDLIQQKGECSFDDALRALVEPGSRSRRHETPCGNSCQTEESSSQRIEN